ncbi:cbb3-type cytochrome c oxidase subunit 3 [Bradyrhizobium japonicum]|uniref:cbb3-type cytochrome c oxidase subunit 3 n=1 Tax=Bradyrhizobium japonicum TaxID=375 RepID=UPI001BAA0411|nr:cbb3-type cytochrome c oxidase subunit 3 [Bradyrhizobium japonicum]MBR0750168.1 cbb3-type cytochrome c oxidase subunit 3 [Bradyrhizobium japonicum]
MDLEHATLVRLSKSFGLFYLIALSIITVVYAYWPSNRKAFDRAAKSILRNEDGPWR